MILGFGQVTEEKARLTAVSGTSGMRVLLLTNFDIILALPDQCLHGHIRVTVFFSVVSWVGNVLRSGSVVTVTNRLLQLHCCL